MLVIFQAIDGTEILGCEKENEADFVKQNFGGDTERVLDEYFRVVNLAFFIKPDKRTPLHLRLAGGEEDVEEEGK